MPSYYCFLCATDEGVFLDITGDNKETFRDQLEACLSLKISESKTFSNKICHKCAYELHQCKNFLEKYKQSRQWVKSDSKVTRPCCSLCLDQAKKEYLFDLSQDNNSLNNPAEKLQNIFSDKVAETHYSNLICLKCRYLIDVLCDLQTIFQVTSIKLQNIHNDKIDYLNFPKINTTVVNRKTTTTEFKRLAISTPSNSDSDTSSMTRGRYPNNRVNNKSSSKPSSLRKCDECRNIVESGGDMYRFYRTGLTVCKSCWLTKDPNTYRFKKKNRRNSTETKLCSVFLKDVLMDDDLKSQKVYRVEEDGQGNKVFIITDDSSENESKSQKESTKSENDGAPKSESKEASESGNKMDSETLSEKLKRLIPKKPKGRKRGFVGKGNNAVGIKKKKLDEVEEKDVATELEEETKDDYKRTRLRSGRGASDTEIKTTTARTVGAPKKQGKSDTELDHRKAKTSSSSDTDRKRGRKKKVVIKGSTKDSQKSDVRDESGSEVKKKRGRKRKKNKVAEEKTAEKKDKSKTTNSAPAFGIETRMKKRRKSSKEQEVVAYVDLVMEEEKEEQAKEEKRRREEEEKLRKEEEEEEDEKEKSVEKKQKENEEVLTEEKEKGDEEENEKAEEPKETEKVEEAEKEEEEEEEEEEEVAVEEEEKETEKEDKQESYPCIECGLLYRNKVISLMHRMKHYKQLKLKLEKLVEESPKEEEDAEEEKENSEENTNKGNPTRTTEENEENEKVSEDDIVINVVDDEEESLRQEEIKKNDEEKEETKEEEKRADSDDPKELDESPEKEMTEEAKEAENGLEKSVLETEATVATEDNGEILMEDESSVKSLRLSKDSKDSRRESRESKDFNDELEEKEMEEEPLRLDSGDHEVPTASPRKSEEKESEARETSEDGKHQQNGIDEKESEISVEGKIDDAIPEVSKLEVSETVGDKKVEDDEDEEVDVEGDEETSKESPENKKNLADTKSSPEGKEEKDENEESKDETKSAKEKENLDVFQDSQSPTDSTSAAKEVLKEVFELATAELERRQEETVKRTENGDDEETLENISREVHNSADMPSLDPIFTAETISLD